MRGSPSGDQVITPLARDITKGRGEYVRAQNWSSRVIEREEEAEKEREREEEGKKERGESCAEERALLRETREEESLGRIREGPRCIDVKL